MQLQKEQRKEVKRMACIDEYKKRMKKRAEQAMREDTSKPTVKPEASEVVPMMNYLFGVYSEYPADDMLQNNISLFEWVLRTKIHPSFWGRNITGDRALTKEEIRVLHRKACKIAAVYTDSEEMKTAEQGRIDGADIDAIALDLGIPEGTAVYVEIRDGEEVTSEYLMSFARTLLEEGYTPGFKVSTDAKFVFDREFSRGMQQDRDVFMKCLIWATSPVVPEYDGMTTSHLIHPDHWKPFAPSGTNRRAIGIWQYGRKCHPIEDDDELETTFDLNLVRNKEVIVEKMF